LNTSLKRGNATLFVFYVSSEVRVTSSLVHRVLKARRYNIATSNMEANPNGVSLSIILFVNKSFHEFSILHLGPKQGQRW
jgi:hypothetical protein